jgi:hypothetical protein
MNDFDIKLEVRFHDKGKDRNTEKWQQAGAGSVAESLYALLTSQTFRPVFITIVTHYGELDYRLKPSVPVTQPAQTAKNENPVTNRVDVEEIVAEVVSDRIDEVMTDVQSDLNEQLSDFESRIRDLEDWRKS